MKGQIQLAGVGGQGIISTGRLLLDAGLAVGESVRGNETHGMSQRGGAVTFQVRIGDYKGVLISEGQADIIIATEPMEAVRNINFLKDGGVVILNEDKVIPSILNVTKKEYPSMEKLIDYLKEKTDKVIHLPARKMAEMIGNPQGVNIVLLGVMCAASDIIDKDVLRSKIAGRWPKVAERNLKAFDMGYNYLHEKEEQVLVN